MGLDAEPGALVVSARGVSNGIDQAREQGSTVANDKGMELDE